VAKTQNIAAWGNATAACFPSILVRVYLSRGEEGSIKPCTRLRPPGSS
jgi:hypothetical protein